eukprot:TRINITY_DN3312_c0_g1_i1.p1 TRINITY_DN3312_c0_g1~~TRINITY_DN3312_c0_g1_i1.p1  ORF type:complete len:1294 (-),score=364.22 TRINITY_DN3312_c0_g1_i1:27-3428(-)
MDHTDMEKKLASIGHVHGSAARWFSFADVSSLADINYTQPTSIMVINSTKEKEIDLGRDWHHRKLGPSEVHVSTSLLERLNIQPNAGEQLHVVINLVKYMQDAQFFGSLTAEQFILNALTSSLGVPLTGVLYTFSLDLPVPVNGTIVLNATQVEDVYDQVSSLFNEIGIELQPFDSTPLVNLTDVALNETSLLSGDLFPNTNYLDTTEMAYDNGTTVFTVTYDLSPLLSAAVDGILQLLVVEKNYTVVDAVPSPKGKYPTSLGSVTILEAEGVEAMVNAQQQQVADMILQLNNSLIGLVKNISTVNTDPFNVTIFNTSVTVNGTSVTLNVTDDALQNATDALSRLYFNLTQHTIQLENYAFIVVVLYEQRLQMYLKKTESIKTDMITFTNDVAEALGTGYPATFTVPLTEALDGFTFVKLFLQQIFMFIAVVLIFLGSMLIYSLLISDVESKTYEYGMLRALGMMHYVLIELICMQSLSFSIPGILIGLGCGWLLYLGVAAYIAHYVVLPIDTSFTTSAVLIACVFGFFMPIVANIVPIRRALSKVLRDALDLYHNVQSEKAVKIQRLENMGLQMWQIALALLAVVFGFVTYYLIPYAFVYTNFTMFFSILVLILLGFLFGLSMLAQVAQPYGEQLLVWLLVWGPNVAALKHLVTTHLAGHVRRNQKTAIMVTTALAFIIFAGSVFAMQSRSLGEFVQLAQGSDLVTYSSSWYHPLPEDNLTAYLDGQYDYIEGYSYITFPLRSHPDITDTEISNLGKYPTFDTQIYGITRDHLSFAYDQYYVPAELAGQFHYDRTPEGKKDAVKSLYDDAGNQTLQYELHGITVPPAVMDTSLYTHYPVGVRPLPTETVYRSYIDIVASQAFVLAASVDTVTPLRLDIDVSLKDPEATTLTYLAKARAMVSMVPGFTFTSYRTFAWGQPTLVTMDSFYRIMCDAQSAWSALPLPDRPPKQRLLVRMREGAGSAERRAVAGGIRSLVDDDYVTVSDTPDIVKSTVAAMDMLNLFFIVVAAIAIVLCFFVLWLSFTANVRENSWEFAVLRAIGLRANLVTALYVFEALCLVLSAVFMGTLLGIVVAVLLTAQFDLFTQLPFQFDFPIVLFAAALVMSFVVAVLGSLLPATAIRIKKIGAVLKGR